MPVSRSYLRSLSPRKAGSGQFLESDSTYAERIRSRLPNFPAEVISQWFYEHPQAIERYCWLDFPNLHFEAGNVGADVLSLSCLKSNPTVTQYRDHFLGENQSRRMERLAQYIALHGTWPVPPIMLSNISGEFVWPRGTKCTAPYELIEGSHPGLDHLNAIDIKRLG